MWLAIEGDLRFLSHRDCARLIERAAARAKLPLKYTQGFNPHPVLALVCPRPVGVASRDDLAVAWLTEPLQPDDIVERMSRQVPRGMAFLRACELEGRQSLHPLRARYECPVPPGRAEGLRRRVEEFQLAPAWPAERRIPARRPGQPPRTRGIDLKELVVDLALDARTLRWALVPAGDLWARPAEVLQAVGLDPQVDLAASVRTEIAYGP